MRSLGVCCGCGCHNILQTQSYSCSFSAVLALYYGITMTLWPHRSKPVYIVKFSCMHVYYKLF